MTTPPPATPLPGPGVPREPWYRREGAVTRVLAVAGAVVTLSGVAMLLVLAVRQGWFGPGARVTAGALLALVLGGLGARGGARDRDLGRSVGSAPVALVATGAAAAYLDVVAVTAYYGWVPPAVGLALAVVVAVAGLWLARTWASELLAVLMVAGAAGLSPFVAGRPGWLLSAVLAVLALVGWWAADGRPAPRLTVVRTTPVALSLLAGAVDVTGRTELLALDAVALVVLLGGLVTAAGTMRRHPSDPAAVVTVALGTVGMLAVGSALDPTPRTLSHALVAAVLLLATAAGRRGPVGPLPVGYVATTSAGAAVAAVLAVLAGAPDGFAGTGLLLLAVGYVALAGATRSRLTLALAAGLGTVAVLAWLPHPAASLSVGLAERHDLAVSFVDSALVVALVATATWATLALRGVPDRLRTAVRVLAVGLGLGATTTALVAVGTLAGLRFGEVELGFTTGHAVSTLCWMAAAALLLQTSLRPTAWARTALPTGLAVAALAVAKLFLFDLAALDGVVRSVAFIGTGLLLLATGSRYARSYEKARAEA